MTTKTITIKYVLTAPLSHIGETASTGSYFQTILTSNGRLPVVTGNAIRGQLRDCGAKHLLNVLGEKVDKEVFHVLFSGGNLSGSMKDDVAKAKTVREQFPLISLFGGGLGDMIMAGKMSVGFAYPICKESEEFTGIESDLSWKHLIEEIEFTRTDDSKNDKNEKYIENIAVEKESKASTQMRYSVQYLAAGTELLQKIKLHNITELEYGAFIAAVTEWFKNPTLGGMSNKGFGKFNAFLDNGIEIVNDDIKIPNEIEELYNSYKDFLQKKESSKYFSFLKGAKKDGKKSDKTAESDSDSD